MKQDEQKRPTAHGLGGANLESPIDPKCLPETPRRMKANQPPVVPTDWAHGREHDEIASCSYVGCLPVDAPVEPRKEWMPWPGGDCPHCGGSLEVFTVSRKDGYAYDCDEVRCVDCHCPGSLSIGDEDDVNTLMHDEPNCDCPWCLAHPVVGCKCGHCTPESEPAHPTPPPASAPNTLTHCGACGVAWEKHGYRCIPATVALKPTTTTPTSAPGTPVERWLTYDEIFDIAYPTLAEVKVRRIIERLCALLDEKEAGKSDDIKLIDDLGKQVVEQRTRAEKAETLFRSKTEQNDRNLAALVKTEADLAAARDTLASQGRDHKQPCTLGSLCPWCEIERVREREAKLREALEDARGAIVSFGDADLGQHEQTGHYFKDELLAKMDAALAATKEGA